MKYCLLFSFLVFVSCSQTKKIPSQESIPKTPEVVLAPVVKDTLVVHTKPSTKPLDKPQFLFEKKCPIGKCPDYQVTISNDRRAIWIGHKNVQKIGNWQAVVTQAWMLEVTQKAEQIGFQAFQSHYPPTGHLLTDLPSTKMYLTMQNGSSHSIIDSHDSPKSLQEFETWLADKLDQLTWSKASTGQ
jgi:hypothetical protein